MRAFAMAAGMALLLVAPAGAQDMNTLNRHLEHQQWQRLQDHQNRARSQRPRSGERSRARPRCSADSLPSAERRRLEREYARRLQAEGRASADRWIRGEGMRYRCQLEARGIC